MAVQKKPIYTAEEKWAKEVIRQARTILSKKRKNASRELYQSLKYKITPNGIVFYFAKQGEYLEHGRPKGIFPPIEPLVKWAKDKGLGQWTTEEGKPISDRSQAYLIARSIFRNGIKPLAWFSDPYTKALKTLPKAIEDAIVIVINGEIAKIIKAVGKQ